jgi:hypothetical protein
MERSKNSQEPLFPSPNSKILEDESSLPYNSTSMLEAQEQDKIVIISNSSNVSLGQFREICKTKKSIKKVS